MVNDSEARELSGDWNIHRAGRWILAHGPKRVVIKQGEFGALLIESRPSHAGLPARGGLRPDRCRRRLRRRFHGVPGAAGRDRRRLRRAMVYGGAMGSFAVSQFGIKGFEDVTTVDVEHRVRAFRADPRRAGGTGPMTARQYAAAGVDLANAESAKARIGRLVASTRTPLTAGRVGAFGGMVRLPAGLRQPTLVMSTDGVGTKVLVAQQAGRYDTVGECLVNHSVNDILVHGARPIAFMDYVAGAGLGIEVLADIVEGVARGCRAHAMDLAGGETAQMPGLYAPVTSTWPAPSSAWWRRPRRCTATRSCRATCCSATPPRPPHQRLHPGPPAPRRPAGLRVHDPLPGPGRRSPRRSSRCTGATPARSRRCSAGPRARPHHRRRHRRQPGPGAAGEHARGHQTRVGLADAAIVPPDPARRQGKRTTKCAMCSTSASA